MFYSHAQLKRNKCVWSFCILLLSVPQSVNVITQWLLLIFINKPYFPQITLIFPYLCKRMSAKKWTQIVYLQTLLIHCNQKNYKSTLNDSHINIHYDLQWYPKCIFHEILTWLFLVKTSSYCYVQVTLLFTVCFITYNAVRLAAGGNAVGVKASLHHYLKRAMQQRLSPLVSQNQNLMLNLHAVTAISAVGIVNMRVVQKCLHFKKKNK